MGSRHNCQIIIRRLFAVNTESESSSDVRFSLPTCPAKVADVAILTSLLSVSTLLSRLRLGHLRKDLMQRRFVDLSYPLDPSTPPFPGDSPVEVEVQTTIPAHLPPGTPGFMNTSNVRTSLHTGTHMDAFFHFFHGGATIDQIPLTQCIGPALMIDLSARKSKKRITAHDLAPHQQAISQTPKVILNTGWAQNWGESRYFTDYPPLTEDAARFLVDCAIELIGIDTPSVDYSPYDAHFVLLGNDVLIVENLTNLDQIGQPLFEFAAIPLKITGRDGSPVRAIAVTGET